MGEGIAAGPPRIVDPLLRGLLPGGVAGDRHGPYLSLNPSTLTGPPTHFGAGAGFWNVMWLYPSRGLGIVVMSNSTRRYDFEPLFALLASASWS